MSYHARMLTENNFLHWYCRVRTWSIGDRVISWSRSGRGSVGLYEVRLDKHSVPLFKLVETIEYAQEDLYEHDLATMAYLAAQRLKIEYFPSARHNRFAPTKEFLVAHMMEQT